MIKSELNFQKKFMATKIHEIFETEQGLPKVFFLKNMNGSYH